MDNLIHMLRIAVLKWSLWTFEIQTLIKGKVSYMGPIMSLFWRSIELKHKQKYVIGLCNKCMLMLLYLVQHGCLLKNIVGYNQAKLQYPMAFGLRDIAYRIWWLWYNFHQSKWPKTSCGHCINGSLTLKWHRRWKFSRSLRNAFVGEWKRTNATLTGIVCRYLGITGIKTDSGPCLNIKTVLSTYGNSMLKIRRPLGRLIFNMGIAIPGKTVFLIETAPRTRQCLAARVILFALTEIWFYIWRQDVLSAVVESAATPLVLTVQAMGPQELQCHHWKTGGQSKLCLPQL